MTLFFPIAGAAVAVAGGDKLLGDKGYDRMFRRLGWSRAAMQAMALAEVAGGLLMLLPRTRRMGGMVLAAASASVLADEVKSEQPRLAGPRAALMLLAMAAIAARRG